MPPGETATRAANVQDRAIYLLKLQIGCGLIFGAEVAMAAVAAALAIYIAGSYWAQFVHLMESVHGGVDCFLFEAPASIEGCMSTGLTISPGWPAQAAQHAALSSPGFSLIYDYLHDLLDAASHSSARALVHARDFFVFQIGGGTHLASPLQILIGPQPTTLPNRILAIAASADIAATPSAGIPLSDVRAENEDGDSYGPVSLFVRNLPRSRNLTCDMLGQAISTKGEACS